jgi:hypothetical protein
MFPSPLPTKNKKWFVLSLEVHACSEGTKRRRLIATKNKMPPVSDGGGRPRGNICQKRGLVSWWGTEHQVNQYSCVPWTCITSRFHQPTREWGRFIAPPGFVACSQRDASACLRNWLAFANSIRSSHHTEKEKFWAYLSPSSAGGPRKNNKDARHGMPCSLLAATPLTVSLFGVGNAAAKSPI